MRRYSIIFFFVFLLQRGTASSEELLTLADGTSVTNADAWSQRRAAILQHVTENYYGSMPPKPAGGEIEVRHLSDRLVCGGKARETLSVMLIHRGEKTATIRFGIVRPVGSESSPVIIKNDRWVFDLSAMLPGRKRKQYQDEKRVEEFHRVRDLAISRGYAICKFNREDVAIDGKKSRETGVLALYPDYGWGAIAAWGWAYQPIIDHLLTTGFFDADRIIATGHSRGGKAALAATIFDPRIAIAAPSASGSGGTGSWKQFTPGGREQTARNLAEAHGHWFGRGFSRKAQDPGFDGDSLLSLIAPRGLINTHGKDDPLANPRGTRAMFESSDSVFALLGAGKRAATHWRPGGHGHLQVDWKAVLDYADAHFAGEPIPEGFNNWPADSKAHDDLRRLDRANAVHTYKEIDGQALKLHAFYPAGHEVAKPAPAIIFFHGGGWRKGTPASMAPHCRYFASRGLVSFTASYRFASEGGALQVQDCVEDAMAATQWLVDHAGELGIDPERLVVSGGSAGGHLAMMTALTSKSSLARACLLFNPAAVLTPQKDLPVAFNQDVRRRAATFFRNEAAAVCPLTKIRENQPPMLLMHGRKDWLLPAAQKFVADYRKAGNRGEILVWEGQDHGFYHFPKNRHKNFIETCEASDRFLTTLGLLSGKPSVRAFLEN